MNIKYFIRPVLLFLIMVQVTSGPASAMDTQNSRYSDSLTHESATMVSEVHDPVQERPVIEYLEWIRYRLGKLPLLLVILYGITLVSILTMMTLLVIILFNRSKIDRENKIKGFLLEEYQRLLMNYLFDDGQAGEAYQELKKVAGNRQKRQILIDQIMDLMVNLKGEIKTRAKELYFMLGLKKDTMIKVKSRKWHLKIKGYRELSFMDIRDANSYLIRGLNSDNDILRMEAQIALVRLSDGNSFDWLNHMKKTFAKWDQITLVELIRQHEMSVPSFKQWFDSQNISVLIFAIEMIETFEQVDAECELVTLFDHPNKKVRHTAYRVSGNMNFLRSLAGMKDRFGEETFENKLEILNSFVKMPDEHYLDFLKSVLDNEEDVQLQIRATKAIESMDEPGISMLVKIMKSKSEYRNYQIVVRHVLDGRIN